MEERRIDAEDGNAYTRDEVPPSTHHAAHSPPRVALTEKPEIHSVDP
jgi:hypothetical protein